jgi:Cu-Zn family superoxide dismutase
MNRITTIVLLVTLAAPSAEAQEPSGPPPVRATFAFLDTAGTRIGQITAIQQPTGTQLQILVHGLSPGLHGMHLHANPACEPPAFQSAGSHLNPGARKHGHRNPDGTHLGDLTNLRVNDQGEARAEVFLDGLTLTPGPASIGQPGTALVIHASVDDDVTDPTGNSGARIACAVMSIPAP